MTVKEKIYKTSGYYGRFRVIILFIIGTIFIILGIVLSIISKSINALILSAFGLFGIIYGWILWKRCKSLIKGRF